MVPVSDPSAGKFCFATISEAEVEAVAVSAQEDGEAVVGEAIVKEVAVATVVAAVVVEADTMVQVPATEMLLLATAAIMTGR